MMSTMSAVELTEWQIIEGLEPFGERRADWRASITFATLIKAWGVKGIDPSDILKNLMDVFESAAPTIDEERVRQAKIESAALAWASVVKETPG